MAAVGSGQSTGQGFQRTAAVGQQQIDVGVVVFVVVVLIFVADFGVELLVRLEVLGQQQLRIFGHKVFGQSGQTAKFEAKTIESRDRDIRSKHFNVRSLKANDWWSVTSRDRLAVT